MIKILIAEDEFNIRNLIAKSLVNAGYIVKESCDGKEALYYFNNEHFDLILTDIMMPKMDGNELVKNIREINTNIPILMLTALENINDIEKGFNNGADDYLVKPILMRELVIRIKALLRRFKINNENIIELANTVINYNTFTVNAYGVDVELTKKEFMLLFKLLSNHNIIFTREQLMDEIWGFSSDSNDRTIDTHISWIREKVISEDFEIKTVRGLGYKAVIK